MKRDTLTAMPPAAEVEDLRVKLLAARAEIDRLLDRLPAPPAPPPEPPKGKRWMSQREFAAHVGASLRTVQQWTANGIPHLKFGRKVRIEVGPAEEWLRLQNAK